MSESKDKPGMRWAETFGKGCSQAAIMLRREEQFCRFMEAAVVGFCTENGVRTRNSVARGVKWPYAVAADAKHVARACMTTLDNMVDDE